MRKKNDYTRKVDKVIGLRIKKLRTGAGITQKQFARSIQRSAQQVSKYERGVDSLNSGQIMIIAKALNRSASYFFQEIAD